MAEPARPWCRGLRLALLVALAGGAPGPRAVAQEPVGVMDYDWRLAALDGAPVPAATLRGQVVFLNVWATWCRPCVQEMPSIQALHDRFAPRGVRFVALAADRPNPVARFLARHRLDLPAFLELDAMPAALGVATVPTTLVVDRQGRIVLRHRGVADWDRPEVHAFLEALLAPPAPGAGAGLP